MQNNKDICLKSAEKAIESLHKDIQLLDDKLKAKEQECEELKNYIKNDLAPHAQMLQKQTYHYKEALEKIEKLADYFINENDFCKNCNGLEFCHQAINIINEVKEW